MSFIASRSATLAFLLGMLPALALAETNSKAEARKHFDRGVALTQQKNYGEAVAELKRAYELDPEPGVLFELGETYAAAGQPVQAVDALGRYLSAGGAQIPDERRRQVEAEIVQQETRIATVTVTADLSGAVIRLDGAEIGRTPLPAPIRLGAGVHTVDASLAGYLPYEQKLDLQGGEHREVEFTFRQQPGAAGAAAHLASGAPLTRATVAYVVGAVGVAALAVGGVFGFRAISKRQDSDRECPQNQCTQRGVDLNNQAKTAALVADITIGAGLLAVGVATYLLLTPGPTTVAPPGTLAVRGVHLSPAVGPAAAGLQLGGSW